MASCLEVTTARGWPDPRFGRRPRLHKFHKPYNCAYRGSHLAADPSGLKAFQVSGITCTFFQRLSA